ncbi:hypothetical protein GCM10028778_20670 [Barrientosiimonas marina]
MLLMDVTRIIANKKTGELFKTRASSLKLLMNIVTYIENKGGKIYVEEKV